MCYTLDRIHMQDGVQRMNYEIVAVEENRIYMRYHYRDELDGFIMLLKSIEGEVDGRILQVDGNEIQYTIEKDPYGLIYKWDSKEGIVIFMEHAQDADRVIEMLQYQFQKLS